MSRRSEMLGSTIQRELAEFIQRELNDPRLPTIVSITRVKVSDDLEYADVFVSIMGTPGQQTAALNALKHSAGLMRFRLTKALSIRQAPFIRFQFDEQLKKELEILEVLERLRVEREEKEARDRAAQEAAGQEGGSGVATPSEPATPSDDEARPSAREQKDAVDGQDPSEQQSPT